MRELSLANLIDLVRILETTILDSIKDKYQGVLDDEMVYFNEEKVVSKEIIYKERFESKMKLNSRLNLEIQTDPYYKEYNDILIHRTVFTMRPKQMLVILFNKRAQEFSFVLYDTTTCSSRTKRVPVGEVEAHIPHLSVLLENNKFTEVGRRIVAAFKNSMLVGVYIHENDPAVPM